MERADKEENFIKRRKEMYLERISKLFSNPRIDEGKNSKRRSRFPEERGAEKEERRNNRTII